MAGWDGKKTEPMPVRVMVCAGCGKQRHSRQGMTLVRVGDWLIHDDADCRLLKAQKARQREAVA